MFFDTQGHARHHFCIYDALSNGVFTGDTFGVSYAPMKRLARGLIPSTPPVQFDPAALYQSVARIMSYHPASLYLTHYGELVNPAAQVSSFNRWIDEYVALCRKAKPADPETETAFESSYGSMILDAFTGDAPAGEIARVLQVDIRLNAQGLAHWWRSTQND